MRTKKSLLLVELDYHEDLLCFLIELIDKSKFNVTCAIKKEIFKYISDDIKRKCTFFIIGNNLDLKNALNSQIFDLVIFNTCASKFYFWQKHCPESSIIRIHNVNAYFLPLRNVKIRFNFLEIRKAFTYLILHQLFRFEYYYMKLFLKKVNYFSFMSDSNQNYFLSKRPDLKNKIGPILPLACYESRFFKHHTDEIIKIVVPGTPEKKRRDFQAIKQMVAYLSEKSVTAKITFAGKAPKYSLGFLNKLSYFGNKNLTFQYFNKYLSHEEFNNIIKDADILFFPLIKTTRYKIFQEVYGTSKISGSVKDMIRFGKISILPEWYSLDKNLQHLSFTYSNNEDMKSAFDNAINQIKNSKDLYKKVLLEHEKNYSFQNIFIEFNNSIKNLIQKISDEKNS